MSDKGPRDYENFALVYDELARTSPYNRLLDRPAVLGTRESWAGLRVLDLGCAGGHLAAELADRGAEVTGFDLSPSLVELAAERVPAGCFFVHDAREPLPLESGSFDVAVASLVLHYLEDWVPVLRELRRVLAPGGSAVMTTGHPMADPRTRGEGDYFATELVSELWSSEFVPQPLEVSYYRRPLAELVRPGVEAGLSLARVVEVRPREEDRDAFGARFEELRRSPWFIALEWRVPEG